MPAPYSLRVKRSAEGELRGLPKADLKRLLKRIEQLASQPRPPGCEKLAAHQAYRIRQGDYRVVYVVDDAERTVEIIKVGHRREVYR